MYNENVKIAETNEPDFQRIISVLREQISKAEELCKITNGVIGNIKPFSPNGEDKSQKNLKQEGLVGVLWEEIDRLRLINYYAEVNYTHLKSLIGS